LTEDAVVATITRIWEETLQEPPHKGDDNFFLSGGDSIAAIQMVDQLNLALNINLRFADFLEAQTPDDLTSCILTGNYDSGRLIVPLAVDSLPGKVPLYLMPPVGGSPASYLAIVGDLRARYHVYGLQAVGLDFDASPLTSIDAIADRYVKEIASHRTTPVYFIAGWSFGAFVAFEVAIRLTNTGDPPTAVILFDPLITGEHQKQLNKNEELEFLITKLWRVEIDRSAYEALDWNSRLDSIIEAANRQGRLKAGRSTASVRRSVLVYRANTAALAAYCPRSTYPGRLHIFTASSGDESAKSNGYWKRLAADGIHIIRTPGDHRGIFEGVEAQALARRLRQLLDEVTAKAVAYLPSGGTKRSTNA
jgi:thioesterase domain-containing protein/acyl carrier protein